MTLDLQEGSFSTSMFRCATFLWFTQHYPSKCPQILLVCMVQELRYLHHNGDCGSINMFCPQMIFLYHHHHQCSCAAVATQLPEVRRHTFVDCHCFTSPRKHLRNCNRDFPFKSTKDSDEFRDSGSPPFNHVSASKASHKTQGWHNMQQWYKAPADFLKHIYISIYIICD